MWNFFSCTSSTHARLSSKNANNYSPSHISSFYFTFKCLFKYRKINQKKKQDNPDKAYDEKQWKRKFLRSPGGKDKPKQNRPSEPIKFLS